MGAAVSWTKTLVYKPTPISTVLCDDLVYDESDLTIKVFIYTNTQNINLVPLVHHLQMTKPVYTYSCGRNITLLYSPDKEPTHFRSNISGEMIVSIASDVTSYLIKNNICDPASIEVKIIVEPHALGLKNMLEYMEQNNYQGNMHGLDNLSAEKIKEQFGA
jgi:hypothetical protein